MEPHRRLLLAIVVALCCTYAVPIEDQQDIIEDGSQADQIMNTRPQSAGKEPGMNVPMINTEGSADEDESSRTSHSRRSESSHDKRDRREQDRHRLRPCPSADESKYHDRDPRIREREDYPRYDRRDYHLDSFVHHGYRYPPYEEFRRPAYNFGDDSRYPRYDGRIYYREPVYYGRPQYDWRDSEMMHDHSGKDYDRRTNCKDRSNDNLSHEKKGRNHKKPKRKLSFELHMPCLIRSDTTVIARQCPMNNNCTVGPFEAFPNSDWQFYFCTRPCPERRINKMKISRGGSGSRDDGRSEESDETNQEEDEEDSSEDEDSLEDMDDSGSAGSDSMSGSGGESHSSSRSKRKFDKSHDDADYMMCLQKRVAKAYWRMCKKKCSCKNDRNSDGSRE